MRIIGELPHEVYKISIFKINTGLKVQFEDGNVELVLKFRDGVGVDNVQDVKSFLNQKMMEEITLQMNAMAKSKNERLTEHRKNIMDNWPKII
jgi:hypothetical protein